MAVISYAPHVRLCISNGNLIACVSAYAADGEKLIYTSGNDSIVELFKIGSDGGAGNHWEYAESDGIPVPDKPVDVIILVEKGGTLYRTVISSDKAEPCD